MHSFDEFRAAMLRRIATIVHVDVVHSADKIKELQVDDIYMTNILLSSECLLGWDMPEDQFNDLKADLLNKDLTVQEVLDTVWKKKEEATA